MARVTACRACNALKWN